jgi:hypothetical protein
MTEPKTLAEQVVRAYWDEVAAGTQPVTDEEWERQKRCPSGLNNDISVALAAIEARDKEWREFVNQNRESYAQYIEHNEAEFSESSKYVRKFGQYLLDNQP